MLACPNQSIVLLVNPEAVNSLSTPGPHYPRCCRNGSLSRRRHDQPSLVYWLPRSERCSNASGLPCRQIAIIRASVTNCAVISALIDPPTGEEIDDGRNIEPAFRRSDIREVSDLFAVGSGGFSVRNGRNKEVCLAVYVYKVQCFLLALCVISRDARFMM